MGRPKGSKNKPKHDDIEAIPEAPAKPQNKVMEHALKHNFKFKTVTHKLVEVELSGQDSFTSFTESKGLVQFRDDGHNTNEHFAGGSNEDIVRATKGKFNTEPFLAQQEKLKKQIGNALECLEAELVRKRTRFMSEHDGELDFDRLYERDPFQNTRITNNGVTRVIDVNVMFHFSGGVSSENINEYGTLTWAVVDMLEKAGIRCNVNLCTNVNSLAKKDGQDIELTRYKVRIKGAEEYIDTMDIARHFTSNYFRRVMFNTMCVSQEALEHEVHHGLGYPERYDSERKSTTQKGVLNLEITQMKNFKLDTQNLIKYIREAL